LATGPYLKLGYLAQFRADTVDNCADRATDLHVRCMRMPFGGKINDQWTFFFDAAPPAC
jgi:hypothetical protein